jgi:sugar transferase (PEP-CTERM/EpsH1 system associated)
MKILFLAHRTPYPPDKGDKIRSFHLLAHLAKTHDVTLVYWVDDARDLAHATFLKSLCRGKVFPVALWRPAAVLRALRSLLCGRSFTEGYYFAKSFQRAVTEALRAGPFDAALLFSSGVAPYGRTLDAKVKVVDFVDVDSDKWGQLGEVAPFPLSVLFGVEQRRLARLERDISSWADCSLFISSADAELFKNQGGSGRIEAISNGTDLELRRLPLEQIPFHGSNVQGAEISFSAKLIFVGTMNYQPNVDAVQYFAEKIFPLIRKEFPRAVFEIVGRYPTKSVKRLEAFEGVRVIGEVPDVRSHLLHSDVSVAPMRIARGVQNKVLEAMAMGVPVVATSAAVQGLEVSHGQEVLIGNDPREFAQLVISVLRDAELRRTMTKKASSKMKQLYSWEMAGAKLEKLLSGAWADETKSTQETEISISKG